MRELSLVVTVINEEDNIHPLIEEIRNALGGHGLRSGFCLIESLCTHLPQCHPAEINYKTFLPNTVLHWQFHKVEHQYF